MSANLFSLATEVFGDVAERFELKMCESTPEEMALIGSGYAILIWSDRDGISLHYLDLDGATDQGTVDLGVYLATNRRWVIDQQTPRLKNHWSAARRGLHNSARTLIEVAPDILRGEKAWLTESPIVYNPLSDAHREKLLQDIARCLADAAAGSTHTKK